MTDTELEYKDVFVFCPSCRAPIQRTFEDGSTIMDGLKAHWHTVHKGERFRW